LFQVRLVNHFRSSSEQILLRHAKALEQSPDCFFVRFQMAIGMDMDDLDPDALELSADE